MKQFFYRFSALTIILVLYSCATFKNFLEVKEKPMIPRADREFRAAWVATVDNIDWPSKPGLPVAMQKAEAVAILDSIQSLNLNAVIFQVRPHCDALYQSKIEPWSYYLTGKQGKAPKPLYDPLTFWIKEAHTRGLELHAWFNPYRAHHPSGGDITETSIVRKKPSITKQLKKGFYWLDPADKRTQKHSLNVIMDVVSRYDIDGVHIDDYFYPYPSYYDGNDFPDDNSWLKYKNSGGKLSRGDWRRKAVNDFVKDLYRNIKKEKKYVKFGISPFGIWRPNFPVSIKGFDQYNKLYADARLWLHKGWIDYFTPQLYWPINQVEQSFPVLLGWWNKQNIKGRNLWPGLFTSRVTDSMGIDENLNQIMITRGMLGHNPGHVHFSVKAFMRPDSLGLNSAARKIVYKKQAVVPAFPWLDSDAPDQPIQVDIEKDSTEIIVTWNPSNETDLFSAIIYYHYGNLWDYKIVTADQQSATIPAKIPMTLSDQEKLFPITRVAIALVDRCGNESDRTIVSLN